MNCSPPNEILNDGFLTDVANLIPVPEAKTFFIYLGFDWNDYDHFEKDHSFTLEGLTACLQDWKEKDINKEIKRDRNTEEIKIWIIEALQKCDRRDLADRIRSFTDIDVILDLVSQKVTGKRQLLFAKLGIQTAGRLKTGRLLKDETKILLNEWIDRQTKQYWKYQELLSAFREMEQNHVIDKIVTECGIMEYTKLTDDISLKSAPPIEELSRFTNKKSLVLESEEMHSSSMESSRVTKPKQACDDSKSGNKRQHSTSSPMSKEPETKKKKTHTCFQNHVADPKVEDDHICLETKIHVEKMEEEPEVFDENNADSDDDTESVIELRDYQTELTELALKGINTIICAGTGAGKTYVALYIMEKHLQQNRTGKVAFLARTNVLLSQQYDTACEMLPALAHKGQIRKWEAGTDVTNKTFKNMVNRSRVIFITPKSLWNYLDEEDEVAKVHIEQFSMLVFDECHHTFGKSPYNEIMGFYRKLKYGTDSKKRLQVLGLTASPGTNKARDKFQAKDHLIKIMANLDVSQLSVVEKHKESLLQHSATPDKVVIQTTKRKKDPVKDLLINSMKDVEDVFDSKDVTKFLRNAANETEDLLAAFRNVPRNQTELRYISWIADTKIKVEVKLKSESQVLRLLHACLRHLEFYAGCLEVNSLLDIDDVRNHLTEGHKRLTEESARATTAEEKRLIKILDDFHDNVLDLGRNIERNPDIEKLIAALQREYERLEDESRFMVFVKTRTTAKAVSDKMPEHFNSRHLTGSQVSKEEGGLTREEQTDIVNRFREGKYLCIVATSVAAEGLDIPKCTMTIQYRLQTNEITSFQMRGRIRKQGKEVYLGSQEEIEREEINIERQYLMKQAIDGVVKGEDLQKLRRTIANKELNIYQMEEQERQKKKHNPNEENKGKFYVNCKLCGLYIIDGQDIRRIKKAHCIVCDPAILEIVDRFQSKKPPQCFNDIKKTDKVYGKTCGHNWGSILIYHECEFVSLSQDYIQIIAKDTGVALVSKKWSDVHNQFPLDDISDEDMIRYRSAISKTANKSE